MPLTDPLQLTFLGWSPLWGDGRIEDLGRPFRDAAAAPQLASYLSLILVPLAACLLGFAVHRLANRPRRISHSLETLTLELYRLHRIERRHRRLLADIAEAAGIAGPALMMSIPEAFDAAAQAAQQRLRLSPREIVRLQSLRSRLFAQDENGK